jgi:predicted phosphodiesterase
MTETIRIAHITDTHLGYRALNKQDPETGRNQRTVDFERALETAIDDILRRDVDAIIHAGDVFHHSRPTWQSLRHFIQQFRRIEEAGIPTLVIAGNHDTPRLRTGGSAYSVLDLALSKIRFVADYEDVHEAGIFKDLNLHVHAIPHGALTNDDPVIPEIWEGRRNILVTHGMVPGILDPGISAEPGEQILNTATTTCIWRPRRRPGTPGPSSAPVGETARPIRAIASSSLMRRGMRLAFSTSASPLAR